MCTIVLVPGTGKVVDCLHNYCSTFDSNWTWNAATPASLFQFEVLTHTVCVILLDDDDSAWGQKESSSSCRTVVVWHCHGRKWLGHTGGEFIETKWYCTIEISVFLIWETTYCSPLMPRRHHTIYMYIQQHFLPRRHHTIYMYIQQHFLIWVFCFSNHFSWNIVLS